MSFAVRSFAVLVALWLVVGCTTEQTGSPHPAGTSDAPASVANTVPTVLILDASGSMTTPDAPGLRIDAAKAAAKGLIRSLPDNADLGLITYGTGTGSSDAEMPAGCLDVTELSRLGRLNRGTVTATIEGLVPRGYTPISLALQKAAAQLPTDGSAQAIVLVSDGEDTCGSPPCAVAKDLKAQHPGLAVSTVGFRTEGAASDQLSCIAQATGGVFVQAGNANQLAARLLATQDVATANQSLSAEGRGNVRLGMSAAQIRAAHSDFPEVTVGDQVVVVWADCEYTFAGGKLIAIAPRDGGRTIDGIAPGADIAKATDLYGAPLDKKAIGTLNRLIYAAAQSGDVAYEIDVDGYDDAGVRARGTVKKIVLCMCRPVAMMPAVDPCAGGPAGCVQVGVADVDGDGRDDRIGMSIDPPLVAGGKSNRDRTITVRVTTPTGISQIVLHGGIQDSAPPDYKQARTVFEGAFRISRTKGADLAFYIGPESWGATSAVVGWSNGGLQVVTAPGSSHGKWGEREEFGNQWVTCGNGGEVTINSWFQSPGSATPEASATTYHFAGGVWNQTGTGRPTAQMHPNFNMDCQNLAH